MFWPALEIEGESAQMTLKVQREVMTNSEKERKLRDPDYQERQ